MGNFDFLQNTKRRLEDFLLPAQGAVNNQDVSGMLNPLGGGATPLQPPQISPPQGQPNQPQIPLPADGQGGMGLGQQDNDSSTLQEIVRLGTIELLKSYLKALKGGDQNATGQGNIRPQTGPSI